MEMVLFDEDWDKYPHYHCDTKTRNPYFLNVCQTLKSMGVKNHLFPLQLHNRELIGVNPRDPDLPMDLFELVVDECYNNFFYALREVLVAPGSTLDTPIWYEANRANMFMYWTYLNGCSPYVVVIRQGGKSYAMDVKLAWAYELRLQGCSGSIITKDEGLRSQNMERLRRICNEIPIKMRGRTLKDAANSEVYKIPDRENIIRAVICPSSIELADRVCRGQTDTDQNWDEVAYLHNFLIALGSAAPAGARGRNDAKLRGDPYGSMFGTTAGRRDTRSGKVAYELMLDATPWDEALLDSKDRESLQSIVRQGSRRQDLLVFGSFLHSQIGRSDQWLQDTMKECRCFGEEAEKDFGNRWLSGTLSMPFSTEDAERIEKSQPKEIYTEISGKSNFAMRHYTGKLLYSTHHKHNSGVMGMDTSDGIGRDDIGIVVSDVQTGGTTAASDFNNVSLYDFSEYIADYMLQNPKVILVPESRSTARAVMDHVAKILISKNVNPFTRIFNTVVQWPEKHKLIKDDIKYLSYVRDNYGYIKKFLGFATAGSGEYSRDNLFKQTLTHCVSHCGHLFHDSKLIKQTLAMEIKDGRLDHGAGKHDDMLVSKLLGHWFLMNGNNLDFYGLDRTEVFRSVKVDRDMTEGDKYKNYMNVRLKDSIQKLATAMESELDPFMYDKMERRLENLYSLLTSDNTVSHLSLSDLLESIEAKRNIRT